MSRPVLNLPEISNSIETIDGQDYILDSIRKKKLVLTPEEWVRQHVINYLIRIQEYPKGLISCEKGLDYNSLLKRTDILVYGKEGNPFMLVECKAPQIKLSQSVYDQAARYNHELKAPFIMLSNGLSHLLFEINHITKKAVQLSDFPQHR